MLIDKKDIERIKQSHDLKALVESYGRGAVKEEGNQLRWPVPVPQRENAVVHGESQNAVVALLRLRRRRGCDQLCGETRGAVL